MPGRKTSKNWIKNKKYINKRDKLILKCRYQKKALLKNSNNKKKERKKDKNEKRRNVKRTRKWQSWKTKNNSKWRAFLKIRYYESWSIKEINYFIKHDTDFFGIVAGVLQRGMETPYLFIICQVFVHRTSIDLMKENGFTIEKARNRKYTAQTMTDADYADDIALLTNTPSPDEYLLHSLEKAAGSIGLRVNADKTEYVCFNQSQRGDISNQTGGSW